MFTGIIEAIGLVKSIHPQGANLHFFIESPVSSLLRREESIAHNGVCLTVTEVRQQQHQVTAIGETLLKTNLKNLRVGDQVNLERSILLHSRLDGHLVQGHVDCTGICQQREEKSGSWEFRISFPGKYAANLIEKGSICLNGISLTIFKVADDSFSVAIIPFTMEHTNMSFLFPGQAVNLEFDVIGKYVTRYLSTTLPGYNP